MLGRGDYEGIRGCTVLGSEHEVGAYWVSGIFKRDRDHEGGPEVDEGSREDRKMQCGRESYGGGRERNIQQAGHPTSDTAPEGPSSVTSRSFPGGGTHDPDTAGFRHRNPARL